jgi:hypothetical protein
MTIKSAKSKITIDAPDLSCTLTELQSQADESMKEPPSLTANSVCYDESYTIYAKETLTVLRAGSDVFLIDAGVLLRQVNEYSTPKIDEAYTNKPPFVIIYRKVR